MGQLYSSFVPSLSYSNMSCSSTTLFVIFTVLILVNEIRKIVFPPLNFPRNIPTIPFYVSFLGLFTNYDQEEIFNLYLREKMEEYGAVKIYFASRWNILVTRPSYLKQVVSDEKVFTKSGNHKKIPYSVLAEYTGDNLISATGETWQLYRSILTTAIQFPNLYPIKENLDNVTSYINGCLKETHIVQVSDFAQLYCLQNLCECMLGFSKAANFHTEIVHICNRLNIVKSHIFKPIFLNFPVLDRLPIASRRYARLIVSEFRKYFCKLIKTSEARLISGSASTDLVKALKEGVLTKRQFSDNAMIIMIAGHENPQLLLSSVLYVLAKHPSIQEKLRSELVSGSHLDTNKLPYLNAVIYETLRMYPPLGQIINKCTTENVVLGDDIQIPKGAYVGYNNFATGRDRNCWDNADTFEPERWGTTVGEINRNYALAKSKLTLAAFHGRKRACLGEKFALNETRQIVLRLISTYKIRLDPNWEDKLTPGGPVSPLRLKLHFTLL